jgi:hypothetical protein
MGDGAAVDDGEGDRVGGEDRCRGSEPANSRTHEIAFFKTPCIYQEVLIGKPAASTRSWHALITISQKVIKKTSFTKRNIIKRSIIN